jgi:hypothetical protein
MTGPHLCTPEGDQHLLAVRRDHEHLLTVEDAHARQVIVAQA